MHLVWGMLTQKYMYLKTIPLWLLELMFNHQNPLYPRLLQLFFYFPVLLETYPSFKSIASLIDFSSSNYDFLVYIYTEFGGEIMSLYLLFLLAADLPSLNSHSPVFASHVISPSYITTATSYRVPFRLVTPLPSLHFVIAGTLSFPILLWLFSGCCFHMDTQISHSLTSGTDFLSSCEPILHPS